MVTNITALVVNYGTPEDLWRLVSSAETHEDPISWVCFDNAHPDRDSGPMLMALSNRLGCRFSYIRSETNRGHGHGINRAAEMAVSALVAPYVRSPDAFFIVNPDCEWREPVLPILTRYLRENDDCAIVGPKQLDLDMKITAGGIVGTGAAPKHRNWKSHDPENIRCRDTVPDCPTVAGSAMLVRSDVFSDLGGMLETDHYFDETWLCYHARAHGWKAAYCGEAWMIHKWHQSTPIGSKLSDGKFDSDQKMFRRACDIHEPPIERD